MASILRSFKYHLLEFTQCIPLFSLILFIHNIQIASLFLFIKDPVCFCFISGAKVVRVLEQKQGWAFQFLVKNLHPCGKLLCPSRLCLWGRFGIPYGVLRVIRVALCSCAFWVFDLVLGITVGLVVIFRCMGSCNFIC